jgi:hypothetical protein
MHNPGCERATQAMLRGLEDETMRPAVFQEEFRVTAFAFLTTANLGVEGVCVCGAASYFSCYLYSCLIHCCICAHMQLHMPPLISSNFCIINSLFERKLRK